MLTPTLIALTFILAAALALLLRHMHRQTRIINAVVHLLSNMSQGQYARRTYPDDHGEAGDLARAANTLAADLETRSARAQQDKDHLLSLLAVMDHTNEIALATDNMDTIRLANPAAAQLLGRPADTLQGKHIEAVIHQPELRALYRSAFSASQPVSSQITIQAASGPVHLQATAATIYTGAHYRGTLLILRDVTEIARTIQMKTDFVANASHELRTPLASIRAAVETLKESDLAGSPDADSIRRCIDIINNHALRLQLLVQDLLDLSRTEDPRSMVRHDRLDLTNVCELVTGMYSRNAAEKHIALLCDLADNAKTLRGDERLLTLTLKNLVDNAIKFTQTGSVTIRSYLAPDPKAASSGETQDSRLKTQNFILEVVDTGIGIPPEDQQRVFERFYTVNRSRGGADRGTGLGLAIVKHAIAAMNGAVELISAPNHGTTIRCTIPQPTPAPIPEPASPLNTQPAPS